MSLTNDVLIEFDGNLRHFLFTRAAANSDAQGKLEGVPPVSDTSNLTTLGAHLGTLKWKQDMSGYTLVVDLGLGGKRSNIELSDCALSQWRLTAKEGGTVVAKVNLDAPDVAESAFGKLAKLKSREIEIRLVAPEVSDEAQQDAEGKWPFPKNGAASTEKPPQSATTEVVKERKGKSATDTFVETHGTH